ncbi:MAG: hypothetical protein Q9201_000434 [Fulgogasparrea decipioides]
MVVQVIVPHSLRVGEVFTVAFGFGLSTVAICARIYTKLRIVRNFLSEDYFSIAGYLFFLVYLGLAITIGKNSGGVQHKAYLSMVETVIYNPTIIFVKISILLQYITLFVAHRRNLFHYACHVLIWVNVLFYTIMTFSYVFECKPRRKLWIPHTPGHCRNEHARGLFSGSINVVSDFLILILPLPILLRLQMPSGKKLRLLLVFGVGLAACVASIVRLVYTVQINPDIDSKEYQLQINKEGLCAMAEIAIGIIVGCMPHVHKSFLHFSAEIASFSAFKLFSSSTGSLSWRRLFSRPSTSEAGIPQKRFGSDDSGSAPPQIRTLNMTRASFTLDEKELPQPPLPIYNHKTIPRKPLHSSDIEERQVPEKIDIENGMAATETASSLDLESKIESQMQSGVHSWQRHQNIVGNRANSTRRARYESYQDINTAFESHGHTATEGR